MKELDEIEENKKVCFVFLWVKAKRKNIIWIESRRMFRRRIRHDEMRIFR